MTRTNRTSRTGRETMVLRLVVQLVKRMSLVRLVELTSEKVRKRESPNMLNTTYIRRSKSVMAQTPSTQCIYFSF